MSLVNLIKNEIIAFPGQKTIDGTTTTTTIITIDDKKIYYYTTGWMPRQSGARNIVVVSR